jgi:hypothetical protein
MGVSFNNYLFMSGGRDGKGLTFSDEVYRSANDGVTWSLAAEKQFGPRAYHVHLVVNDCQIIMGGQTFTTFYNDVWKSCDALGEKWELVTDHANWPKRAGHAATVTSGGEMIVAGGCYNKNDNPLRRSFYGDVWASGDGGVSWEQRTPKAQWTARSGPRLIEDQNGQLLLVAGEIGFTEETQLVDVWGSTDKGSTWTLVANNPGFSPRSGHGVVFDKQSGEIIVMAGWPHLHDMYSSFNNGQSFDKVSDTVWNCDNDDCGKYDFWPIIHQNKIFTIGGSAAYSTFGKLWQDTWVANLTKMH